MKRVFSFFIIAVFTMMNYISNAQWKPLSFAVRSFSLELQSAYTFKHKAELSLGLGVGLGSISSINKDYYEPNRLLSESDVDMPHPFFSAFYRIAYTQRIFTFKQSSTDAHFYIREQFKHFFPSKYYTGEHIVIGHSYRLATLLGFQLSPGKRKMSTVGLEMGAAIWSNYNLSFISAGPQLSMHFERTLFH